MENRHANTIRNSIDLFMITLPWAVCSINKTKRLKSQNPGHFALFFNECQDLDHPAQGNVEVNPHWFMLTTKP